MSYLSIAGSRAPAILFPSPNFLSVDAAYFGNFAAKERVGESDKNDETVRQGLRSSNATATCHA